MCGYLAVVGSEVDERRVAEVLRHRGPDDWGFTKRNSSMGPVTLVSTRLAIRDLSVAGHMPMTSDDGAVVLSYNGELYNESELRQKVVSAGYSPRGSSDTELLLRCYQIYGIRCVDHLDGMFSFAIWDSSQELLFVARDHFGIKPLYYGMQSSTFACGSEIKAILEVPEFTVKVNKQALKQYLSMLWVPDPLTMFDGIFKLEPGHFGVFKSGRFQIESYWNVDFRVPKVEDVDEEQVVSEFRGVFFESVKRQLISDVPVGAFLSAGMDSSSIVAAMAHSSHSNIRTFTVGTASDPKRFGVDDVDVARRTADFFGTIHNHVELNASAIDQLSRVVWHLEEPTADPAAIAALLVNQAARPSVTVLLSGVGGDELLGGYRKYSANLRRAEYQRLPKYVREGIVRRLVERLPNLDGTRYSNLVRLAKKFVRSASMDSESMFLNNSMYASESEIAEIVQPAVWDEIRDFDPWYRHRAHMAVAREHEWGPLEHMLYLDLKTFMPNLNLNYNDKMSMAASTEVRVPFLDKSLVEFVCTRVPTEYKLSRATGHSTKYLLRKAMTGIIPDEVLQQRKAGFGAPIADWLRGPASRSVAERLAEGWLASSNWIQPKRVVQLLNSHLDHSGDYAYQLWTLLSLDLWAEQFNPSDSGISSS